MKVGKHVWIQDDCGRWVRGLLVEVNPRAQLGAYVVQIGNVYHQRRFVRETRP